MAGSSLSSISGVYLDVDIQNSDLNNHLASCNSISKL